LAACLISYYAFSSGTYLGQVYATLFPDQVRRMVLDSSSIPPGLVCRHVDHDYAFPGAVMHSRLGSKLRRALIISAAPTRSAAACYRAPQPPFWRIVNGPSGADEFDDTFLRAAYLDEEPWPVFASSLSS